MTSIDSDRKFVWLKKRVKYYSPNSEVFIFDNFEDKNNEIAVIKNINVARALSLGVIPVFIDV